MGSHDHKEAAGRIESCRCAVLTVSDSRTEATDESGKRIRDLLGSEGHQVVAYQLLPNDSSLIGAALERLLDGEAQVVIITGGTGFSRKDVTIQVVTPLLEKTLDGFGELFRALSYQEIGSAAIMSRALAGLARGKLIVALPGSLGAVDLALRKLLLPELRHLVWEINR